MQKTHRILLLFSLMVNSYLSADSVVPIDKVIKERKSFYDLNGSVEIETTKHDVDYVKESGVILSKEKEDEIKHKRTPKEIKESMAVYRYGETVKSVDGYVKQKLKAPKRSHIFKAIKTEGSPRQPQKQKKNTMLHQLYYGNGKGR